MLHIRLQKALYGAGVGAAAAQIGRRVKGALTGSEGEALGVQHDAGKQGLGLAAQGLADVGQLLNDLGHKLTGRRGVGLDKVQSRV